MLPQRRQEQLLVEELPSETLVYDLQHHRSHCLNRVAAQVWKRCDGQTPVPVLAAYLAQDLDMPADTRIVNCALEQLRKARLLREDTPSVVETAGISRRQVLKELKRYGISAAMVLSITAPTVAQASSVVTPAKCRTLTYCGNQLCTNGRRCKVSGSGCDCI